MTSDEGRADSKARGEKHGLPAADHTIGPLDKVDGLLALLLIAICAYFYFETTKFPAPAAFLGDNVLPGHFPRMLLYAIAILACIMPFEHLLELERWPLIKKSRSAPIGMNTFATMGFLIVLVAVATTLGTVLTILAALIGLPLLWGERRFVLIGVYAVLFTAVVTYLFSIVLSVYFEPGVFNLTLR